MTETGFMHLVEELGKDFEQSIVDWQLAQRDFYLVTLAGIATIDRTMKCDVFPVDAGFARQLEGFGFHFRKQPLDVVDFDLRDLS